MGVGECSVCASVRNMGGGGGVRLTSWSWTLCEQLVWSFFLFFSSLSFSHLAF